jgi:hypothetical protein
MQRVPSLQAEIAGKTINTMAAYIFIHFKDDLFPHFGSDAMLSYE